MPIVPVPTSLRRGAGDPAVAAVGVTAYVFGQPRVVAGRPADAADAVAQLEWITVELATDQRWIGLRALVVPNLRIGRAEVRQAFGIPADTTPTAAVEAFDAVAQSLRGFDVTGAGAALEPLTGRAGISRALDLLDGMPVFPRAAFATAEAQRGVSELARRSTLGR